MWHQGNYWPQYLILMDLLGHKEMKQPDLDFFDVCGDSGEIGHLFRLKTAGGSDSNRPPKSERSDAGF
jgi:hypothetical protein